jgi:tetratricopeptide (TPR) repeat protein
MNPMHPQSPPRPRRRRTAALTVLAVVCLAAAPAAAQERRTVIDEVVYLDGAQQKSHVGGTVESHGYDQLVYARERSKVNVPGTAVVEVRWGDATPEWTRGWRALASGDGAEANRIFCDLVLAFKAKPDVRAWVNEYGHLGLGEAQLLLAATNRAAADKAVEAFEAARAANPKSLAMNRVLSGLANAHLAAGRPDPALAAADALVSAGRTAARPRWELAGHLARAQVNVQRDNHAAAASALDDVIRVAQSAAQAAKNPGERAELRNAELDAAARKGWLLMDKAVASRSAADFSAAEAYFSKLASDYPGEAVVAAAASNAKGVRLLASDRPKEALRELETTEVRHFGVPGEVARSLYYQAEAHAKLNENELRAERLRDLKEFYPDSEWARKAQ